MSDKFELEIDPDFSKHASLVCPESESRYLHIEKVYDYTKTDKHAPNTRSAAGIVFETEGLSPGKYELCITNHKGVSEVYWRENPRWEPAQEDTQQSKSLTNISVPEKGTTKWSVLVYLSNCDEPKTTNQMVKDGACIHASRAMTGLHKSQLVKRERVENFAGRKYKYELTPIGKAVVKQNR